MANKRRGAKKENNGEVEGKKGEEIMRMGN